jgi:hypothetical protein
MREKIEKLKPAGVSWIATSLLLIVGTFYEVISEGGLGLLSVIFFISKAVYWATRLHMR